jgi:large subunit ribosomal protein L4
MPSIIVLNQSGAEVGTLELSEKVFAAELHNQAVYDVVNSQRAGMRQGTSDTKDRTEVRGGGRKPWRQKGTGRARQGSIRAPQWRGGGVVFGPTPRKYVLKVNKKLVKTALRSLLTDRFQKGNLVVVDKIVLNDFKTKSLVEVLKNLNAMDKKTIVITTEEDYNLVLAGRNIPNVYVQTKSHLSVYDLINANMYVATEDAIKAYEEELQ